MSDIVRYYVADNNPGNGRIGVVPLSDLTQAQWDRLPEWDRAAVDASPMYRKTKPRGEPQEQPAPKADKE